MAAQMIPAKELKLRDVVQCFDGPFGTANVVKVEDAYVTVVRPYGVTEEWSYTGGVLAYVGTETFTIWRDDKPVKVWERKEVK